MNEAPMFDRNNLSDLGADPDFWPKYRKLGETRMYPWKGAAEIETLEGPICLPADFDGFIAIDHQGYPYPIDGAIHRKTYEVVG